MCCLPVFVSLVRERQTWRCSSHPAGLLWRSDWDSPPSHFSPHWSAKPQITVSWSRCNKHHIQERERKYMQRRKQERSYVFECRRDRFRFVLVLRVLVCHLKDVLLFLPLLFVLPHVTWGEEGTAVSVERPMGEILSSHHILFYPLPHDLRW